MLDSNTLINVFNSDAESDGEDSPTPEIRLIEAAKACDLDALRRALAEGCDVNYREPDSAMFSQGYSALHHLCTSSRRPSQRLACVLELIARGADVNLRAGDSKYPSPPIANAVRLSSLEVVKALIDAGADVNMALPESANAPGLTALHTAAIFACPESIRLLVAAGADVDAVAHNMQRAETPLEAAIRYKATGAPMFVDYTRTFACLVRAGARIPTHPSHPSLRYLDAVAAAGGFARYERAHRTRLAAIFIPKFPQLPAEVVHHILPFWADVGGR